jgi:hypothetical protein
MPKKSEDKKADFVAVADRGETVSLMEPLLITESSRHRTELTDLTVDLAAKAAGFCRSLPAGIVAALADLVRAMNCYYSNLIEGHDTHPIDIERALKNDYSTDPRKRDLQLEAKAHVAVQRWIDDGNLRARATTADGIREIHRRFCELLTVEETNRCDGATPAQRCDMRLIQYSPRHYPLSRFPRTAQGSTAR